MNPNDNSFPNNNPNDNHFNYDRRSNGQSNLNRPSSLNDPNHQLEKEASKNNRMKNSHRGYASDEMRNSGSVSDSTPISNQIDSRQRELNQNNRLNISNGSNNNSRSNNTITRNNGINNSNNGNNTLPNIDLNQGNNGQVNVNTTKGTNLTNRLNPMNKLNPIGVPNRTPKSLANNANGKNFPKKSLNPKVALFNAVKNKLTDKKDPSKQSPIERDEKEKTKSNVTIKVPFKVKIAIAAIVGGLAFVLVFFIAILGDESISKLMGIDLADIFGKSPSNTGMGSIRSNINDFFSNQYEDLGNIFTDKLKCEDEECSNRNEILFYKKIGDISLRYKNKYHIDLDWPLIAATSFINDLSEDEIMRINLNNYNSSDVSNTSILMNLDWDYDYKNIEGYTYLSSYSFAYDLQILAKNMVKKTTTQTCTDRNGNVIASRIDEDIEEQYFASGQAYHLSCSGHYSINSTYKLDKDKYDEFLEEFIEHKYYLTTGDPSEAQNNIYDDSEVPNNNTSTNIADITISDTGNALGMVTPMNGATITSLFFNYGYSGHNGNHGAVDLSNHNDPRILAAWDGIVVDTGLVMNGYGNQVVLQHSYNGKTFFTHYSHMAPGSVTVKKGDTVKAGQQIGTEGGTGSSATSGNNQYGHHLDFQIAVCDSFTNANFLSHLVNPLSFMDNQISSLDDLTIWSFQINRSHSVVKKGKDYDYSIKRG